MKEAKYFRCGTLVRGPYGDVNHKSLNQAKRYSRRIQQENGGTLGDGRLRVVDRMPRKWEIAND